MHEVVLYIRSLLGWSYHHIAVLYQSYVIGTCCQPSPSSLFPESGFRDRSWATCIVIYRDSRMFLRYWLSFHNILSSSNALIVALKFIQYISIYFWESLLVLMSGTNVLVPTTRMAGYFLTYPIFLYVSLNRMIMSAFLRSTRNVFFSILMLITQRL